VTAVGDEGFYNYFET